MKEFELPEELAIRLNNTPTFFYYLSCSDKDESRVKAALINSKDIRHLVRSELDRVYSDFPELQETLFDYLSHEINDIRQQVDNKTLFLPKEREGILNSLSKIIYDIFQKPVKNFQDNPLKEVLTSRKLTILFRELDGAFEPYNQDFLNYVFNGGAKPKGYSGLKKTKRFKDIQWVYLISELCTNGITDWTVAKALGIKNPAQTKTNYTNNKGGKPKGHEEIDNIIEKVNAG